MFLLILPQFGAGLIVQVLEHADEQVCCIIERLGKLRTNMGFGVQWNGKSS